MALMFVKGMTYSCFTCGVELNVDFEDGLEMLRTEPVEVIKEKYMQLFLSLQFSGIRTITIHSR